MIANLATICDHTGRAIGNVQATREGRIVAIRPVWESADWAEKFSELNDAQLRLMLDSRLYLEQQTPAGKQFVAMEELVHQLSGGKLHLAYDSAGLEQGHQLKRQVAVEHDSCVPFTDLLEILRESSRAS